MRLQHTHVILLTIAGLGLMATSGRTDLNEDLGKATRAAINKVAPSVVQIVTQGGTDQVVVKAKGPAFRKVLGPTTGVIVSKDGYIISSRFNFINNPTSILVEIPGHKEKYIAKQIATDESRMLTLLKIDAKDLPVPEMVAKKDLKVGQWALALGRTLDPDQDNPPSVSMGVISALERIWGKCIQVDANVSPVNYGGPIIDITGKVQGIIIPASTRGTGVTAGVEWYDSGIGFAVPIEDVMAVLPRLKKGQNLKPGLLGVKLKGTDMYGTPPVINSVENKSSAEKGGLKPGDKIVELDGKKVESLAQLKHAIGPKYQGDVISLKYERSGKVQTIKELELIGELQAVANSFMGILPMRDDAKLGVAVRYVYPNSPADKAGLKIGDRIVKYGTDKLDAFKGKQRSRGELIDFLNNQPPGDKIKLEVARKDGGKTDTVTLELAEFPGTSLDEKDAPPAKLPAKASFKKALEPLEGQPKPKEAEKPAKAETGLIKQTTASGNHKYWVYVHADYDPNIAHAMLVWLHPPGKNSEKDLEGLTTAWDTPCREYNLLILVPITDSVNGWVPSDTSTIQEVIRDTFGRYSIDKQRIVAHGLGVGGWMATYLGANARDVVRGVASTGAAPTDIKDNTPAERVQFFMVAGDRDPLAKAIANSEAELIRAKLPTIYREIKGMGRQYLDIRTLAELVQWIDSLDRM